MISKALALLLFSVPCHFLFAEDLFFTNEEQFSGKILSISSEKGVAVETSYSPHPLHFQVDAIKQIQFQKPEEMVSKVPHSERVLLSNGDLFPCTLVALDEDNLLMKAPLHQGQDQLLLPRRQVQSLRFGVRPQRLVYNGPAPLSDWIGYNDTLWELSEFEEQTLLLSAPGEIKQDIGLARQFILQFDLSWNHIPNARIYFCDDCGEETRRDRYYIDINHAGIQIRRERAEAPHWSSLIRLDSSFEAFDDNALTVEIRGNRLLGTMELYLDGKFVRKATDPSERTIGSGVTISKSNSEQSLTQLSKLKAYTWDNISQVQLSEEAPSKEGDSLIDAEGKRMSGQLTRLVSPQKKETPVEAENSPAKHETVPPGEKIPDEENETVAENILPKKEVTTQPQPLSDEPPYFLFKSPYVEQNIRVPLEKARLIYFRQSESKEDKEALAHSPKFLIHLADNGLISADDVSLTEDTISLTHPLVGPLKLQRSAVLKVVNFPPLNAE